MSVKLYNHLGTVTGVEDTEINQTTDFELSPEEVIITDERFSCNGFSWEQKSTVKFPLKSSLLVAPKLGVHISWSAWDLLGRASTHTCT